jgi:hypothetical protein
MRMMRMMNQDDCNRALIEWPDGSRATLSSGADRVSWGAAGAERLGALNFVLRSCFDPELSVVQLARKCLAHDLCPPNGRIIATDRDGGGPPAAPNSPMAPEQPRASWF